MAATGTVLVVTELEDVTSNYVIAELNKRGVPVARFNLSDIGPSLIASAYYGAEPLAGRLETPSRVVNLRDVRSLYWRRPVWPGFGHLPASDAVHSTAQVRFGLGGLLYSLPDCLYVNHPLKNRDAEHKPLQLDLAQRAGFRVPSTLISNDLAEIRNFVSMHSPAIYKALRWTPYYTKDGTGATTWTEPVTVEELDESVIWTPHLFQAQVAKTADVRVVVVGNDVFAVRIDSELLDWRRDYSALNYSVIDLPDRMNEALVKYLRNLGLTSGSFDLCIDQEGEFTWLELNPNGQWGWLEAETDLPLTAAFADLLERGEL